MVRPSTGVIARDPGAALVTFEVLNLSLMLFGFFSRTKCPEVFALSGLRIDVPGINTEFASLELADHSEPDSYLFRMKYSSETGWTGWQ